jgi:formylglycine-generating enzyme required for sulfatase activity
MRHWIGLSAMLIATPVLAQPAEWDVKFYNPHPAEGDLALPLPCGGKLVFRPIDVPTPAGPLDDRPVPMGDPERGEGLAEYVHNENLAAPFPAPHGGHRYWMGKYVVTRDQFAAMGGTCAAPSFGGRVAKTDVSQLQAIQAASAWSSWLLTNARDQLPKRGREFAYVRLPTEVEWEFAARGGSNVSDEAFQGRTWPMPDGIEHYAVAGTAASGRPQQIGVEASPNPLGLYGMLGSVDQMMLEPFRLNRVGRLQGDAGAIILRGGNYKNQPGDLHTGMRTEMPPYNTDTGQPLGLPTVGFRVVLSAPTGGDEREVQAERKAFGDLIEQDPDVGALNDPRKLVEALRKQTADVSEIRQFNQLEAQLDSNERARADQKRDLVRAEIETAALLGNFVRATERNITVAQGTTAFVEATAERVVLQNGTTQVPPVIAAFKEKQSINIQLLRKEQGILLEAYRQSVRKLAEDSAGQDVPGIAALVRQEMENRKEAQMKNFLPLVVQHVAAAHADRMPPAEQMKSQLLAVSAASPG